VSEGVEMMIPNMVLRGLSDSMQGAMREMGPEPWWVRRRTVPRSPRASDAAQSPMAEIRSPTGTCSFGRNIQGSIPPARRLLSVAYGRAWSVPAPRSPGGTGCRRSARRRIDKC
jgi:hypothetical protein